MSFQTEKERREYIEKRRRESAVWQFIHICGSLRLAMILLLTIALACAIATVCESKLNTQVAQAYIYKAPWFVFWLLVLCVNLFAVTLTRWPWQRKHFGFVITHYGIIILLVGAAVGQKLGFEATVTLHKGAKPTNQLVINHTVLQLESGLDRMAYKVPFNVDVRPPTPERPRKVAIPGSDLKLLVDNYTEQLSESTELVVSPIPNTGAGIALEFSSGMMGQTVPVNLMRNPASASANDFFGRARIEFLETLPDRSAAKPPEGAIHETQMVFANYAPVVTSQNGKPSGYRVALVLQDGTPHVIIESPSKTAPAASAPPRREIFEVSAILNKPLILQGETTQIVVKNYWPDMEMAKEGPITKSDQPNNPAILVTLTNDGFGQKEKPLLEVALTPGTSERPEGTLAYQMSRGGVIQASGKAAVGESFQLGWADWKTHVKTILPNAMLRTRLEPIAGPAPKGGGTEGLVSGIHARLFDPHAKDPAKAEGQPVWIPAGRGMVVRLGDRTVFAGFGLEVHSLPFSVELLHFEVPRDEGTETPSDYRSTVRFADLATGQTLDGLVHMNHPASYPAGFWKAVLGHNFKFSQAQWNPRDPDETTLQVLHDPGWPLKWSGSLLICVGIAIMFYLKPASSSSAEKKRLAARKEKKTSASI